MQKNDENSTVNLSVVAGGGGIIGFVLAGYIIVNADVARCFVFFLSFFFFNKQKPQFCRPPVLNAASTDSGAGTSAEKRAWRRDKFKAWKYRLQKGEEATRNLPPPTQQQQQHF